MVVAQGPGVALELVRAVQMVPMHLLEGVVEGVALANTTGLGMVEGLGQVQVLVNILRVEIRVMENLPVLVVPVVVAVEDKAVVIGDLVVMGKVAALDRARAMLIGTGTDQVMEMQMLMAMAVAKAMLRMVEVVVVKVLDLGMVMPIP
ncbi:unnamed protein product, partial [Urochloa humidicola]